MQDTTVDPISTLKPTKDCSGTRLALKDIQIPAALLRSSDPLPQILPLSEVAAPLKVHPDVPAELRTYLGYGVSNMPRGKRRTLRERYHKKMLKLSIQKSSRSIPPRMVTALNCVPL
jgi:hypothetical protein